MTDGIVREEGRSPTCGCILTSGVVKITLFVCVQTPQGFRTQGISLRVSPPKSVGAQFVPLLY